MQDNVGVHTRPHQLDGDLGVVFLVITLRQVNGPHSSLADGRQDVKRTQHQPDCHAAQQLAGLETGELPLLNQVIGHGLCILALLGRDVAQGLLELLAIQDSTAENGTEKGIDRARFRALSHPWLLHRGVSGRPARGSRRVERMAAVALF